MMVYFQNKSKHILLHKYFLKNAPFAWLERKKKENATKSNIEFCQIFARVSETRLSKWQLIHQILTFSYLKIVSKSCK